MRRPPYHFGESVKAASTLHTSRRFHRFLNVSVGHRGSPVIQVRLPEASTLSVGFPPRNMPSPGAGHLPLMPLSTHRFLQNQYLRPLEGAPELSIIRLPAVKHGKIPYKDRVCPSSTIVRRTRQRTAVKASFFTVLDGARPSLWRQRCARRLLAV